MDRHALRRALVAACVALLLSAAGPATSALLERRAAIEQAAVPPSAAAAVLASVATPAGCAAGTPGRFNCDGVPIAVAVQVFGVHASPAALIAAQRDATAAFEAEKSRTSTWSLARGWPQSWRVTTAADSDRMVATALRLGGAERLSDLRLRQALASVLGSAGSDPLPVLIAVSAGTPNGNAVPADILRRFLEAQDIASPRPPHASRPKS